MKNGKHKKAKKEMEKSYKMKITKLIGELKVIRKKSQKQLKLKKVVEN